MSCRLFLLFLCVFPATQTQLQHAQDHTLFPFSFFSCFSFLFDRWSHTTHTQQSANNIGRTSEALSHSKAASATKHSHLRARAKHARTHAQTHAQTHARTHARHTVGLATACETRVRASLVNVPCLAVRLGGPTFNIRTRQDDGETQQCEHRERWLSNCVNQRIQLAKTTQPCAKYTAGAAGAASAGPARKQRWLGTVQASARRHHVKLSLNSGSV